VYKRQEFKENSISPRVAVKYEISNRITIRANAGTGFRAPFGFSEDLHLCSGSPRVWKSSNLKPETSVSFNLSADYYGSKVKISANLFRTDLKDKIAFTDADASVAALGYDYQWKNVDDAFVQGIEVSLMANLMRNLDLGLDLTLNQGKYDNVRDDWAETQYENDSKYISRFPATTGDVKIEYSPKDWNIALTGSYHGKMYIDYFNEDIDPVIGDQTKIKRTKPFLLFNSRVSKRVNPFNFYAGVNNIFSYIQDEKHLDDAAFMYAPLYGTMIYAGITIDIKH